MFAGVENQQSAASREPRGNRQRGVLAWNRRDTHRGSDRGCDLFGLLDGPEVNEPDFARRSIGIVGVVEYVMRDVESEPTLATPTRSGQRDHTTTVEQLEHLRRLDLPTDQGRDRHWQPSAGPCRHRR